MVVIDVATFRATHNYNCMFACFSNPSIGSRPVAVAAKIGCKRGKKLGHGPGKRGPKNLPPKIFTTFLDSLFNVDYDFAIKHDLLL